MNKSEIITSNSWYTLADYCYHVADTPDRNIIPKGILPPNSIVHVHLDEIAEFFNLIKDTQNKYIVISSKSDYGLTLQEKNPPWQLMLKWVNAQVGPNLGYRGINIPARVELSKCKPSDKYALTMYSWMGSSFNEIPLNVKRWYVVNNDIEDERVIGIPFGVDPQCVDLLVNFEDRPRNNGLYVNFSINTVERFQLKYFFKNNPYPRNDEGLYDIPKATVIDEPNKSKSEYIKDLQSFTHCLCPVGNGLDSYRLLESIYAGCVPIVNNHIYKQFRDFPLLHIPDLSYTMDYIKTIPYKDIKKKRTDRIKLSYWKTHIEKARNLL